MHEITFPNWWHEIAGYEVVAEVLLLGDVWTFADIDHLGTVHLELYELDCDQTTKA